MTTDAANAADAADALATDPTQQALVIGASRGLGHAIVAELHDRGWSVVGTVRDRDRPSPLADLAAASGASDGRVRVEEVDVVDADRVHDLRTRLEGERFDLVLVCAGTTSDEETPIGELANEPFVDVMVTNALGPARALDVLADLVADDGVLAALTSGQGSIANNTTGLREVYRASKAALNMLVRSIAVRQADTGRALVLLAPGWIRTDLGGPDAPYTMEETIPLVVDVLLGRRGTPGVAYLDRFGETVPW